MKDLNYELKQLCRRNRDGSYSTQHAREAILAQIANQLHELGFRDMKATSLKPKHVTALVVLWKSQGLSAGTIKNRMTELRWWAEKVNKAFKAQCQAAGIYHVHGHRHKYAQERYRELTGWLCPAQGGPKSKQLTLEQKGLDRQARLTISAELGHGRAGILTTYIGR